MRISTFFAVSAVLLLSTVSAHAACSVTQTSLVSHNESDCASAATVAAQGVTLGNHGTAITGLQGTVTIQGAALVNHHNRISTLEIASASHAVTLADHETRIAGTEGKNAEQDGRLDANDTKNDQQDGKLANHETRITNNTNAIGATNNRLNEFNGTGGTLENWASEVDATNASQNYQLNEHDKHLRALDSQMAATNKRVDKAFDGIAIALAMEAPQVDPGKTFGLALNWGEFEGSNAFAAAAKFRFDNTWSVGGGVGFSGGQVGVRAGVQGQW